MKIIIKILKKLLKPLYLIIFHKDIKIKNLEAKNQILLNQLEYMKRHFDIGNIKSATGWLRDYQLKELNFTQEMISLLNENQIYPFLEGGALLGSQRHNGFIPWDDDIDLGLMRNEFNQLITLAKKKFIWIDTNNFSGDPTPFYDKMIKQNSGKLIFLMTPFCLHAFKGTCLQDAGNLEFFPIEFIKEDVNEDDYIKYRELIIKKIHTAKSWKEIFNLYNKELSNSEFFSTEKTSRIATGLGNYDFSEYKFYGFRKYEEMFPLIKIPFENTFLPGPINPKKVLDNSFSDKWNTFPNDVGISHTFEVLNVYFKECGQQLDLHNI